MKIARWFACTLFLGCGVGAIGCVANVDDGASQPSGDNQSAAPSSEAVGEAKQAICNPPETLAACNATCNGDSYCLHNCNCEHYCKPPTCYW